MIAMDLDALIEQCAPNVAPSTMRAIVKVESGFKPFAIGHLVRSQRGAHTLARQPASQREAVQWASWFLQHGYRFDAGPAQVNSSNFAAHGLTAETAFDPCRNLAAGAAILTAAYRRATVTYGPGQAALRAALSSYNTGSFTRGIDNGYVAKVQSAAAAPAAANAQPPLQPASSKSPL